MASDVRPFGELFAGPTRNGLTRPKAVRGAGVKMVNMGELFTHPRLCNAPMDRVPLDESKAEKFLLKEGDLLFARQSLVLEGAGKCSLFLKDDEPVTFESHVTRVRLDTRKADPEFYFYYLQSPHGRAAIRSIVEQGAGASGIRGSDLETLDVLWRPVDEQHAIAHILGTLENKIELNRRMNETLEAMARALFKSWFVDFDPVRAKVEGRDPGLLKPVADLFTDSFKDSELGEIPKGWEVKSIGDLIERLSVGQKYDQKTVNPTGKVPVLDQGKSGAIGYHDDEPGVVASVDAPVVVFANHTCYMRLVPFSFSAIQNVLPFIGNGVDTVWAFYATVGKQSFSEYKGHWPDFVIHKIVVPDPKLTREFARLVHPLLMQTWTKENEIHALVALRDTLLPKLISGELRVKAANVFIQEATA